MGVRQLPRRQQSGLRGRKCGSLEWEVGKVCTEVRPGGACGRGSLGDRRCVPKTDAPPSCGVVHLGEVELDFLTVSSLGFILRY